MSYELRAMNYHRLFDLTIEWGLLSILIFTPLAWGTVEVWSISVVHFITLIMFTSWLFRMDLEGKVSFTRTPLDYPILAFLALAVISTIFSIYRHDSILELYKIVNYILIYYLVVNKINTREKIKRTAVVIIGVGSLLSIIGLIHYLGGLTDRSTHFLLSTYVNHNHIAGYLELAIPLSIGMLFMLRDKGKKMIMAYCAIIMVVALVLTMSRGGWTGFVGSLLVIGILLAKRGLYSKKLCVGLSFVLIVGFTVTIIGLNPLIERLSTAEEIRKDPYTYGSRMRTWHGTLRMIKDHPFTGTGIGTFVTSFPGYRLSGMDGLHVYTHNDYLQVVSEMGVFALGIIIWLVFGTLRTGFKTFLRTRSTLKQGISLGATAGIVAIVIHSFVDFNLHIPANAILFTVVVALLMSSANLNSLIVNTNWPRITNNQ